MDGLDDLFQVFDLVFDEVAEAGGALGIDKEVGGAEGGVLALYLGVDSGAAGIFSRLGDEVSLGFVVDGLDSAGLDDGGGGTFDADRKTVGIGESAADAELGDEGVLAYLDIEGDASFVDACEDVGVLFAGEVDGLAEGHDTSFGG